MDDKLMKSVYETVFHLKRVNELIAATTGEPYVFDEKCAKSLIASVFKSFDCRPSEEEKEEMWKRVSSTVDIFQIEGDVLLGDYHHVDWYPRESENRFYWERYKNYLLATKPSLSRTIDTFEKNTDKITNLFGDPSSDNNFQIRGLVMGDVQSGKTSTYIGTICKAVDAGYKVVILLTGMVESLRRQTQIRVDEGFIGFDSDNQVPVGVGVQSSIYPRALTSRKSDYVARDDKNTVNKIHEKDPVPLVFVCKKNVSVLKKIVGSLRSLNIREGRSTIDAPLLLIDDEADNASINTNDENLTPTMINYQIRNLLKLFKKATYVGFTATPFANVFIKPDSVNEMLADDLFPRDFIYSLNAPSDYVGPSSVFGTKGKDRSSLKTINDHFSHEYLFSYKHKKDWDGCNLFPSFYESIITFCLANAIRDLRKDVTEHRSMMINMSRFKDVQFKIKDITSEYLKKIKKTVKLFAASSGGREVKDPVMAKIVEVWQKQYESTCGFSWEDVSNVLYESIKDIDVIVVNSASKEKLDYDEHKNEGYRVIAVGGLALSRGLTLEGLIVSYFFRNTSTYDVLMQMGRWFGYRPNYKDLTRIWITKTSASWYGQIADAIEELRKDIRRMNVHRITPKDFGIRVRDDSEDLGITSSNKMKNTIERIGMGNGGSFYGEVFESVYIYDDPEFKINNYRAISELISHISNRDEGVSQPYYRGIDKNVIADLIKSIELPNINLLFDQEQLESFVRNNNDDALDKWDVLFTTKSDPDYEDEKIELGENVAVYPLTRSSGITRDGHIALGGSSAHFGSRFTKAGLSKETIRQIEENKKNGKSTQDSDYMIQGRNPLLIISVIDVEIDNRPIGDYPAFTVCFPQNDSIEEKEVHLYKVNIDADYYKKCGFKTEPSEEEEL